MTSHAAEILAHDVVQIHPARIMADLTVPNRANGIVLFAHGSGSSRFSSRNRFVAGALVQEGFATLLLDLLTRKEEESEVRRRHSTFDIELLAGRLLQATAWVRENKATASLPIGYFGASTGAGAALAAAADQPEFVRVVVSRGGRPDLAGPKLANVRAPTLLIVGEQDETVIRLSQAALARMQCTKKLEIVPGATHLFEEPGALENVARLAGRWFKQYLTLDEGG